MITAARTNLPHAPKKLKRKQIALLANGDLRLSANQLCWRAQNEMEQALVMQLRA